MQISLATDSNICRTPTNIGSQSTSFGAPLQVSFSLWVLRQSKRLDDVKAKATVDQTRQHAYLRLPEQLLGEFWGPSLVVSQPKWPLP
jgi:hypothetical protein